MDMGRTNNCYFDDSVLDADGPPTSGARSSRELSRTATVGAQMPSTEMEPPPYSSFQDKRQGKNRLFEGDQKLTSVEHSPLLPLSAPQHSDSAKAKQHVKSKLYQMALILAAFLCFSFTLAFPFTGLSLTFALFIGDSQAFTSSLGTFAAKWAIHYLILVVVGMMAELGLLVVRLQIKMGVPIDECEKGLVVDIYLRATLAVYEMHYLWRLLSPLWLLRKGVLWLVGTGQKN